MEKKGEVTPGMTIRRRRVIDQAQKKSKKTPAEQPLVIQREGCNISGSHQARRIAEAL